jgi:hypothetical protein
MAAGEKRAAKAVPEAEREAEEAAGARRSAWLFSLKAALTTVGGGLLTLCVTFAQITYQRHLEMLQRQSEQGEQFQAQLFQATGHIENEFIDIFDSLTEDPAAPVDRAIHARLDQLADQWRLARLSFRVRGAQIYGHRVGNLIYHPGEETRLLDACNVEVRKGDRHADRNCPARRRAEARRLRALVDRLREDVATRGAAELDPAAFQANFRLTRTVLHTYVDCRIEAQGAAGAAAAAVSPRCGGLPDTLEILARRIDLMVLAREGLSTEIMRSSALRD